MRRLFTILTTMLMLALLTQFFLAGRGAFTASFDAHRAVGIVAVLLSVLSGLAGLAARLSRRTLGLMGLAVGLMLLQPIIAGLAHAFDDVSTGGLAIGLHAVNGVVIVAVVGAMLRRSRAEMSSPERVTV